jgi:glucose-6-phosphate 1-epimerase
MTPINATPAELDRRFAIAGLAQVVPDEGGNAIIRITTPHCSGTMHVHGAQVTSWKPAGAEEVIFVSTRARYSEGQAIRGGIPICFPWFRGKADDPAAPAHGFVRTKNWRLETIKSENNNVVVTMATESDDTTKKWWPEDFRLQLRATFGVALELALTATNTGAAQFRYEEALHTYYHVGDIHQARIKGLDQATYLDNTDANKEKKQNGDVAITAATDSAYTNNESALELIDPVLHRRIHIAKQNSRTTVIWNPWEVAANKMSDMGADEWKKMLCAEGANILGNAVMLYPGEHHTTTVSMTVA